MENIWKKINELSEKYSDYTADNLSRLVRIKSLTAHEKDVQMELKRQMEEAGFDEVFRNRIFPQTDAAVTLRPIILDMPYRERIVNERHRNGVHQSFENGNF